jgi:3-isopropylmalate/(R)-2-methylmalate dehydratase large subunit
MARTLLDRLWSLHRIAPAGGGQDLIHIDRILLHDLSGARALAEVAETGDAVVTTTAIGADGDLLLPPLAACPWTDATTP